MTTMTKTSTRTMLWPDGHLDIPEELRRELGVEGGWRCSVEYVDGALIVRPLVAIPDEDLWAYTPQHLADVMAARAEDPATLKPLSRSDLEQIIAEHDE